MKYFSLFFLGVFFVSGVSQGTPQTQPSYGQTLSGFQLVRSTPSYDPAYTFSNTIKQGSTGEDVRQLQLRLIQSGYLELPNNTPTSTFGTKTRDALKQWQKDVGLPETGVFGPASISKMKAFLSPSLSSYETPSSGETTDSTSSSGKTTSRSSSGKTTSRSSFPGVVSSTLDSIGKGSPEKVSLTVDGVSASVDMKGNSSPSNSPMKGPAQDLGTQVSNGLAPLAAAQGATQGASTQIATQTASASSVPGWSHSS